MSTVGSTGLHISICSQCSDNLGSPGRGLLILKSLSWVDVSIDGINSDVSLIKVRLKIWWHCQWLNWQRDGLCQIDLLETHYREMNTSLSFPPKYVVGTCNKLSSIHSNGTDVDDDDNLLIQELVIVEILEVIIMLKIVIHTIG